MRNSLRAVVIAMALLLVPAAGRASTILYQATSLGGATWQYDYFLGAGTAFLTQQGFQIYFDGDYSNLLLLPPTPVDWDVLVTQWDPMLSSDGTYDAMATGDNPLFTGPFSVSFTWLGAGAPGSQPFAIYADGLATPLEFIERGDTVPLATTPVPEPSTALLLGSALAALRSVPSTVEAAASERPALIASLVPT